MASSALQAMRFASSCRSGTLIRAMKSLIYTGRSDLVPAELLSHRLASTSISPTLPLTSSSRSRQSKGVELDTWRPSSWGLVPTPQPWCQFDGVYSSSDSARCSMGVWRQDMTNGTSASMKEWKKLFASGHLSASVSTPSSPSDGATCTWTALISSSWSWSPS